MRWIISIGQNLTSKFVNLFDILIKEFITIQGSSYVCFYIEHDTDVKRNFVCKVSTTFPLFPFFIIV